MEILIGIVAVILLIAAVRIATRKRRNARKILKANKRRARMHHGYRRTVKTRGMITPVKFCQEEHNGQHCGLPVSKCRTMQRDAEHATGMLGPRKKK